MKCNSQEQGLHSPDAWLCHSGVDDIIRPASVQQVLQLPAKQRKITQDTLARVLCCDEHHQPHIVADDQAARQGDLPFQPMMQA